MSAKSTALGDSVTIDCGSSGPYGALLRAGPGGNAAMLVAWERLPNGKFGPIQRDGGVRLGDILLRLNTVDLHQRRFEDVMTMLRNPGILNKRLTFVSKEKYNSIINKNTHSKLMRGNSPTNPNSSSRGNRSPTSNINSAQSKPFMSVVRKARVNQDGSSPFAEYEVSCSLRVSSRKVETQRVVRWSVWKRYSEFESLDKAVRNDFGWQLEAKAKTFPAKNSFTWSKLSVDFVEKRRSELDTYWQAMLSVDRIADFNKQHHCSADLMAFLEVTRHIEMGRGGGGGEEDNERRSSKASAKPRRRPSTRPTSVRSSMKTKSGGKRNCVGAEGGGGGGTEEAPPSRIGMAAAAEEEEEEAEEVRRRGAEAGAGAAPPEEVMPFLKMLKMGIPRPAVEQKMNMAGVDASLLGQFADDGGEGGGGGGEGVGGGLPPPPAASKPAAVHRPAPTKRAPAPAPPPAPVARPARPKGGGGMPGGLLADLAKNRIN